MVVYGGELFTNIIGSKTDSGPKFTKVQSSSTSLAFPTDSTSSTLLFLLLLLLLLLVFFGGVSEPPSLRGELRTASVEPRTCAHVPSDVSALR